MHYCHAHLLECSIAVTILPLICPQRSSRVPPHPTPPCPLPSTVHLPPSCKILNSFPVTHRSPSRRSPHQLTNCLTRPMLPKLLLIQWTTWYIVAHFCIKATAGTSQSCVFSWNSIRRGCWAPWAMGLTQKLTSLGRSL